MQHPCSWTESHAETKFCAMGGKAYNAPSHHSLEGNKLDAFSYTIQQELQHNCLLSANQQQHNSYLLLIV